MHIYTKTKKNENYGVFEHSSIRMGGWVGMGKVDLYMVRFNNFG